MNNSPTHDFASQNGLTLQAQDIVSGLGLARRELLATCLALFEDSTLQQRLSERTDEVLKWSSQVLGKKEEYGKSEDSAAATIDSLQLRVLDWMNASSADDQLRLLLWIRLREAFELPARTFGALRSARSAADDLVVAMLASIQPGPLAQVKGFIGIDAKVQVPDSLDALAKQTLTEMLSNFMDDSNSENSKVREDLLSQLKQRVAQLDSDAQARLLNAIDARAFNDDAIRTLLLTGGGLTSFGAAVSTAGFSAYILAAQASAFIPLVSGPALVSFVAVLSNPLTIVLTTLGVGWWAARSANQRIQSAIASRVSCLLALNGLTAGDAGLRHMARAFAQMPEIGIIGTLDKQSLLNYQADWGLICHAHRRATTLSPHIASLMDGPVGEQESDRSDRWKRLLLERKDDDALSDMAGTAVLTLGELLFNLHALDAKVLEAADFSRIDDLSNPTSFAVFADRIESMGSKAHLGAVSNLKGYVAERLVASNLVQQGHVVEFPEVSNQQGWDLRVDGIEFQVKDANDLSLLHHHFEHYDYPVLANAEVADMLNHAAQNGHLPAWADQVHFVEGYSQESVQQLTEHALHAGQNMFHPHVSTFAVMLNALRQWQRYSNGQITASLAIQDVIVNGAIRSGLAVAGNYVGIGIGLLVFGPAGAVVLGSALPILSRTQANLVNAALIRGTSGERHEAWEKQAKTAFGELIEVLESGLKANIEIIKARTTSGPGMARSFLEWRLNDELCFLQEALARLQSILNAPDLPVEDAGQQLLIWTSTSTLHPAVYQTALNRWLEVLGQRPTLAQNVGGGAAVALNKVANFGSSAWLSVQRIIGDMGKPNS